MNIRCIVRHHSGTNYGVWNEGYCFTNCAHCGRDLIRNSGGWHPIPAGFKVVWRPGQHSHAIPSGFKQNLPQVITGRPWWKIGWKLGLHRKGVGCIMLPADPAYRIAQPDRGPALADIIVGTLIVVIQGLLRPPVQRSAL
jgi:hypothetical protein